MAPLVLLVLVSHFPSKAQSQGKCFVSCPVFALRFSPPIPHLSSFIHRFLTHNIFRIFFKYYYEGKPKKHKIHCLKTVLYTNTHTNPGWGKQVRSSYLLSKLYCFKVFLDSQLCHPTSPHDDSLFSPFSPHFSALVYLQIFLPSLTWPLCVSSPVSTSFLPRLPFRLMCRLSPTLLIISPPYHHAISPWQHGSGCNPAADAASLQRGFNKHVVRLRLKLLWFPRRCAAQ